MIEKLEWDAINDNDEAIYFLREKVNEMADRLNEIEPQEEKPLWKVDCCDCNEYGKRDDGNVRCDCKCHYKPQEEEKGEWMCERIAHLEAPCSKCVWVDKEVKRVWIEEEAKTQEKSCDKCARTYSDHDILSHNFKEQEEMVYVSLSDTSLIKDFSLSRRYPKAKLLAALDSIK